MKEDSANPIRNNLISVIEITLVLFPIYLGIWLSAYLELSHMTIWGDIKLASIRIIQGQLQEAMNI